MEPDGRSMYKRNIDAGSRKLRYRGKAISLTNSEFASVAASVIQHTMRVLRVMLSSEASPALPYLSTVSRKWHEFFCSNVFEHKMCVFVFCTNSVSNISQYKEKSARYEKCMLVFM